MSEQPKSLLDMILSGEPQEVIPTGGGNPYEEIEASLRAAIDARKSLFQKYMDGMTALDRKRQAAFKQLADEVATLSVLIKGQDGILDTMNALAIKTNGLDDEVSVLFCKVGDDQLTGLFNEEATLTSVVQGLWERESDSHIPRLAALETRLIKLEGR